MNQMIEKAKTADFKLPVFILPLVAFGLNLIGDMLGGSAATAICDKLKWTGVAANRVLLLSVAVNALLVMLWIKYIERRKISSIGLTKKSFGKNFGIGAIAGFAGFAIIVLIGCAVHVVTYQSVDFSLVNVLSVLMMIPFWIVQAGAEEILTRGWVLPEVSAKTNRPVGIIISSILFVLLHCSSAGLNAVAVINIFLVGVLLAVYTLKSDSLWGAVMFHAFWNFTQGSFFGLSVSGNSVSKPNLMNFTSQGKELLSGGSFGIEASIITTVVLGVLLIMLLFNNKKNTQS